MTKTTRITNLDHVVAWDEAEQRHVYLDNGDLVFKGNEVIHVGPGYAGPADTTIDGKGFMAIPGFVNVHSHPFSEPANKGLTEEYGSDKLGQSSLYEYLPVFGLDPEDAGPSTQVAMSELLKSGVTTISDLSMSREGWIDDLAATGIRAVRLPDDAPGLLVHQERPHGGIRLGREGRREGLRGGDEDHRRCHEASERAHLGHGRPVADRHLQGGLLQGSPPGGQEARHPDADARLPGGRRVLRDGPSPRQDADRMARFDRRAGTRPGDRPRHLPERPSADPLPARQRLRDAARLRRVGGALPDRVRPPRHGAELDRPLHECRHHGRHRHRHLPAQHGR